MTTCYIRQMLYYKRGKQKQNDIQGIILKTIAQMGVVVLEQIGASTVKSFGASLSSSRKSNPRYDISRGTRRLIEKGYIKIKMRKQEEILVLTTKGEHALSQIKYGMIEMTKPKHWDGKWRVVIYDIKEDRKRMRRELREALVYFDFVPIQKSVWVYPYPCESLLATIKADFKIGKEVLYMVVDTLENDKWLRSHFHLER